MKRYQRTVREDNFEMIKEAAEGDEADESDEKPDKHVAVVVPATDGVVSDAEGHSGKEINAGENENLHTRALVS